MIERRHVAHIGHAPRLAAALLIAVAVTACSGGDDDASTTTADSTAPTAVSTSAAPVTTEPSTTSTAATTPSTTEAIDTIDPSLIPPPSSTAPPSTTPPSTTEADVIAEVTAAMNDYYDFYWACLRAPEQCDPADAAAPASDALQALTKTRDDLVGAGLFVGGEPEGYMVIESVTSATDHVLVKTCWWATAVLYGPPGPDGTPVVENDQVESGRENFQFVRVDGAGWRLRRSDVVTSTQGENECPAA